MKIILVFVFGVAAVLTFSPRVAMAQRGNYMEVSSASILHIAPDAPGQEYRRLMDLRFDISSQDNRLEEILRVGARNLDWLKAINAQHPPGSKLSFSSKETAASHPMDKPSIYNADIVADRYATLLTQLPLEMKSVLLGTQTLPVTLPLAVKEYLRWGLKVDEAYQITARWISLEPYIGSLASRRTDDVRGFYFISQWPDRESRLKNFGALSAAEQSQIRDWFVEMGLNNNLDDDSATATIVDAAKSGTLNDLFNQWAPASRATYDQFFKIEDWAARSDVTWSQSALHVPFREPGNIAIHNFLADNIQDEWKSSAWNLILDFKPNARAHMEFKAGTVPHVNAVGGDIITMDANSPLSEYDVTWTIRHEFGHVLGFPDCYLEFYDSKRAVMINYQLDTTNFMCSRQGHLQQRHVDELSRVYGGAH